jgi:predicted RNA-binding protein (virulence factor B family)
LIQLLKLHKGFLPYHDKSSPEDIYAFFGISKKAFKMNVGILYKAKKITIEDGGIRLITEVLDKPETSASPKSSEV